MILYVGLSIIEVADQKMGGSQSVEVPGGGTEGYHVLRVQVYYWLVWSITCMMNDDISLELCAQNIFVCDPLKILMGYPRMARRGRKQVWRLSSILSWPSATPG